MRSKRIGFEFGVELYADEPRVIGNFDDLGQHSVGREAGEHQAMLLQLAAVADVHFVAVAVTLRDEGEPYIWATRLPGLSTAS